jgi:hypothetical protein
MASDSVRIRTERFLSALNDAVDRGEIQRTPETIQALATIPQKRDELLQGLQDIEWNDQDLTVL